MHAAARERGFEHFKDVKKAVYTLEDYCYRSQKRMTVVFDGTRFEHQLSESKSFRVVFSMPGQTGDAVAERLMSGIPQPHRIHATMVTDDSALRSMAVGMGLRTRSTGEFLRDLAAVGRAKKTGLSPDFPRRLSGLP